MIAVLPYCNVEGSPAARGASRVPSRRGGLERLMDDLRAPVPGTRAPGELRHLVMEKIDAEPARVETNLKGEIRAINPAFSAMCGYAFAEIRGRKPASFLQGSLTDPTEVARIRKAVHACLPVEADLVNYHKNGSTYRVRISIEPIRNGDGSPSGFRAVETKIS
jgi:PAS domain S-box-containing protein